MHSIDCERVDGSNTAAASFVERSYTVWQAVVNMRNSNNFNQFDIRTRAIVSESLDLVWTVRSSMYRKSYSWTGLLSMRTTTRYSS